MGTVVAFGVLPVVDVSEDGEAKLVGELPPDVLLVVILVVSTLSRL